MSDSNCADGEDEAAHPPVARWGELPEPLSDLARSGFDSWQASRLIDAERQLRSLLDASQAATSTDGVFHALHLLACVAFSAGDLSASRAWHDQVLQMSEEIAFLGGQATTLFDLAMIDKVEGDVEAAERRFIAARAAFTEGGYHERIPVVDAALEALRS